MMAHKIMRPKFTFTRLPEIKLSQIQSHMNDPRIAAHLPLLDGKWDMTTTENFVTTKEGYWTRDGLGHWGILANGQYIGWGGFQKEGTEWDYGLVLTADAFGMGHRVTTHALDFAKSDPRIPYITFLLPPTRKNRSALSRIGATPDGTTHHGGHRFLKFKLITT